MIQEGTVDSETDLFFSFSSSGDHLDISKTNNLIPKLVDQLDPPLESVKTTVDDTSKMVGDAVDYILGSTNNIHVEKSFSDSISNEMASVSDIGVDVSSEDLDSIVNEWFVQSTYIHTANSLGMETTEDNKEIMSYELSAPESPDPGTVSVDYVRGTFPWRWQKGAPIGSGAYGRVFLAINIDTGGLIAVKIVELDGVDISQSPEAMALHREISVLRELSHKNIVSYLGSSIENNSFNIFLEYINGGSIASLIQRFGRIHENLVKIYTVQILRGLEYLHFRGIIHRDIKGANILIDSRGVIKLADFGASKKLEMLKSKAGVASLKGTVYWMAPEVITQSGFNQASDIWSLGCTVIEMASGKPPWTDLYPNQASALFNIAMSEDPPAYPEDMSITGKNFLNLCFKRNYLERPTCEALLRHEYVANYPSSPQINKPAPVFE
eukprot:TRINITY_DN6774_c0_g1_i3.p1 TRINITY_DN6774_c0_g1~~TRINITY_DN6774_c0_g1_i3.p1  ORF type:complete len:439 (-),score=98.31 TRINITY_DN6774_c0_g1_i3:259-1575(-)